jgi:hypothetical protein
MANYGHMLMRCVWQGESQMFEVPIHPDLETFAVSPSSPVHALLIHHFLSFLSPLSSMVVGWMGLRGSRTQTDSRWAGGHVSSLRKSDLRLFVHR